MNERKKHSPRARGLRATALRATVGLALATAGSFVLPVGGTGARALTLAATVVVATVLVAPRGGWRTVSAWGVIAAFVHVLLANLHDAASWRMSATVAVTASAVFVLALARLVDDRDRRGPARALVFTALLAGGPLWAGPLLETHAPDGPALHVAVAASPLGYLGAATDYDYLRSAFAYRVSPAGALPYHYPSFGLYTAAWLAAAGVLLSLAHFRSHERSP